MALWSSLSRRALRAAAQSGVVLLLFPGGLPAFQGAPQNEGERTVSAVRHWSLGETTRIAIEISGAFEYRHDRLANPDRIYFDIPGSKSGFGNQRVHTIPVADGLLRQIRVSETQPGVTRIVLDLESPAEYSAAQLANPDRLVVELRRKAKSAAQPAKPVEQRVPLPAGRAGDGTRSLVRALGLKLERVVLDPGHGGHDTGTIGPTGLMEKDLVLDVARRLGALIEERLGAEVVYTRGDDSSVPLEARTALANEKEADLFLSIHANSGARSAAGTETYYLNFTTSKSALDVAARENASSQRSIHELQDLIEKIALKDKIEESREFAGKVQAALSKDLARVNPRSRDRGVRKAPFVVLVGAAMPSALAEVAFVSHPGEERLLKRPDYRQKIAEGLYKGVALYASSLSHFQMAETKVP